MTSCTATNWQKKKIIKCFGVCDLNDTLYLSPPLLDLSLSRRSSNVSLKFPSDQKAVVERERLRCVIGFIYTNEKWNNKKNPGTIFMWYNPLHVVNAWPLTFPGWNWQRQREWEVRGKRDRCCQMSFCASQSTIKHCGWTTASIKWFGLFLYYLEDITRLRTFNNMGF